MSMMFKRSKILMTEMKKIEMNYPLKTLALPIKIELLKNFNLLKMNGMLTKLLFQSTLSN